MMDAQDRDGCVYIIFILLAVVVSLIFGIGVGYSVATDDMERDAITHKVGEYYIDKNQDKQFRWIECTKTSD